MDRNAKYNRDKLVDLLAERATFERSAVTLYNTLLQVLDGVADETVAAARDDLARHRNEEQEHAEWVEGLLRKLGGKPAHALPDAVSRESRALGEIIRMNRDGADLLPMFHAMLAAELMDAEGWNLLLELADSLGDDAAVRELRTRVEREAEHLALIRHLVLVLAKKSVQLHEGVGRGKKRAPQQRGSWDVDVSGPARATTDHEKIRAWVEARGGSPAHVKGTGKRGDLGILRVDFPGWSGERSLEHVDWEDWLRAFDENNLAFVYEERMANGRPSRFNKLVARETVHRRNERRLRRGVSASARPSTRRLVPRASSHRARGRAARAR